MYRILAIDYGEVRIGLALTDPLHIISKPFKNIINTGTQSNTLEALKVIISEQKVGEIVLGMPYNLKGEFSHKTNEVHEFYEFLKENLTIPIHTVDERFTTVEANDELKKMGYSIKQSREVVDQIAASIILRKFLACKR